MFECVLVFGICVIIAGVVTMYVEAGKTRAIGGIFVIVGIVFIELYHVVITSGKNPPWSAEMFSLAVLIGGSVVGIFVVLMWCVIAIKGYKIAIQKKPIRLPGTSMKVTPPICNICLGTIKKGSSTLVCTTCGKIYHSTCAERMKLCPVCNEALVGEKAHA